MVGGYLLLCTLYCTYTGRIEMVMVMCTFLLIGLCVLAMLH